MNQLPRAAQAFIVVIAGLSVLALAAAALAYPRHSHGDPWEWLVLLTLGITFGSRKITIVGANGSENAMAISLSFLFTFLALLWLGPLGAMCVSALGCLTSCLTRRTQAAHQIVFNVALATLEAGIASALFVGLNAGYALDGPFAVAALLIAAVGMFATSAAGVSVIIALCTSAHFRASFKDVLWTLPSYLAGASVAAVATVLLVNSGRGATIGGLLLMLTPIALLAFQAFRMYVSREDERRRRIEELQESQARLAELYLATIRSLALAIDAKDQYTHQHILRVQRYAMAVAHQLGLQGDDLKGLETGALLHDIGKLGVPEYVLLKPGRLTEEEFDKIKKHPEIGAAILDPVPFPWPVLPVVKSHHEKWDGTGYPEGLKGEEIPLTARILAVADVYDALTSNRSYRNAWSHERAVAAIAEGAGSHFDPRVAEAFLAVIDGVVAEMALEGQGPLAASPEPVKLSDKAAAAARDIHQASSELWALYEVAQTLTVSLGLQDTLQILAQKLESLLPGTACVFLLRDPATGLLRARAAVGLNAEFFRLSTTLGPGSPSEVVAASGAPYLGEYVHDDLMLTGSSAAWTEVRTALIVPLRCRGETLGTINLYHKEVGGLGVHDQQLLERIAERAALALYNGVLFEPLAGEGSLDPITGLPDRSALEMRAADAIARGESLAVVALDMDSFAAINENFGHDRGDALLREVAGVLKGLLRGNDLLGRIGGDKFVVLLPGVDAREAEGAGQRLTEAIRAYEPSLLHYRLGALRLDAGVGTACWPGDGADFAALLSVAEARLHEEKNERKLSRLSKQSRAA